MSSRTARPTVALARFPGPNAPTPDANRAVVAISPCTSTIGATGCVVAFTPRRFISGRASARIAVSTTGNVSGGQPASTALIATTRRVTIPARGSRVASTSSGSPVACSSMASTRARRRRDDGQTVAQAAGFEQLGDRLGRVVVDLDGARRVRGHDALRTS